MRLPHTGPSSLLSALFLVVCLVSSAAGCGTGHLTTNTVIGSSGTVGETDDLLAGRYDELFPDDRVVTVRITMDEADWEAMLSDVRAKEYYRADIWFDGEVIKDVAVRTKGSSSLMQAASSKSSRVGLKVDFNFFNSARTYHGIKKLCYSNGFSDPTLMKEFLGYELMAEMGVPTPRACFVDLWVNDAHLGVYTQVEAVDAHFVSENFGDGNGNLYKPETVAGRLDWTEDDVLAQATDETGSTTSTTESLNLGGGDLDEIIDRLGEDAGWIPGRTETSEDESTATTWSPAPRPNGPVGRGGLVGGRTDYLTSVGLKTNEDGADYSRLYELLDVLNSDPDRVSTEDLERVLDVDEILRFLAVSATLVHLDNYIGMGHNYYLYDDGGRFSIIPWDLNMGFGGFNAGLDKEGILGYFVDEPTSGAVDEYPLVKQLLSEPEYLEAYHSYLQQLIDGPFSQERMTARIDKIADLIRPYVEKDENVSLEQFEQGLEDDLSGDGRSWSMGGDFIGLAHFVQARTASIAAQLTGESAASNGDGSGNGGSISLGAPGAGGGKGGFPDVPPGGRPGDSQQQPPGNRQDYPPQGMPSPPSGAAPPAAPSDDGSPAAGVATTTTTAASPDDTSSAPGS